MHLVVVLCRPGTSVLNRLSSMIAVVALVHLMRARGIVTHVRLLGRCAVVGIVSNRRCAGGPAPWVKALSTGGIHGSRSRFAVVAGSKLVRVVAGCLLMRLLYRCCLYMAFVHHRLFVGSGPAGCSAGSVKAGPNGAPCYAFITYVSIMNNGSVNRPNGSVVAKCATFPTAAIKTVATVTEAITNAAVVANVLAPVAAMPAVKAAIKAPVTGGP